MSSHTPPSPAPDGNDHSRQRNRITREKLLTPKGRAVGKKAAKIGGIFAAGALAVLALQNCGGQKDYNALNQQPGNESFNNNAGEITMSRLFAAAHIFQADGTSLAQDGFNGLYEQIDKTLDKNGVEWLPFTSNEQNSHTTPQIAQGITPSNPSFGSYHCYLGINHSGKAKKIIVSWNRPEPTNAEKAQGVAKTHKIEWIHYEGQNGIQRVDHYEDGRIVGPTEYSHAQFIGELNKLQALYH